MMEIPMLRRRTNPYLGRLLAAAILLAAGVTQAADDAVFVNAVGGSYAPFSMANGIEVAGGYTPDFASTGMVAEVSGAHAVKTGDAVVVIADGITKPTRLSGFTLRQANASGNGRNTIGMVIRNGSSGLTVENVKIIGAAASPGLKGANGAHASQSPAAAGAGGAAAANVGLCDRTTRRAGGAGAQNPAAGSSASGGAGGAGGTQSSSCTLGVSDGKPTAGRPGTSVGSAQGGAGGAPNSTTPAPAGAAGYAQFLDGSNGARGNGQLLLVNGSPARAIGSPGSVGVPGGGGAGRARAPAAGQPGQAGGNSIGILLLNSNPTIRYCAIERGTGGAGGAGGQAGAAGQAHAGTGQAGHPGQVDGMRSF